MDRLNAEQVYYKIKLMDSWDKIHMSFNGDIHAVESVKELLVLLRDAPDCMRGEVIDATNASLCYIAGYAGCATCVQAGMLKDGE